MSENPVAADAVAGGPAGDGWDAVLAGLGQALPAGDSAGDAAPVPVLADRMGHLVQLRAKVDALLVEQLRVFDNHGGAALDGQTSTLAWTRARLRLGRDAPDLLAVARQLSGLPLVAKAFQAGEVSLEHAAAVARLAGKIGTQTLAGYEPTLLDLARQAPPKQLRQVCDHLFQLLDPDRDADDKERQYRRRYLTAGRTLDGMVHLQGLFDAAAGDVLLAALKAAMPPPAEYEERTPTQRRADALVDICAGWLAAGQAPTAGGIRPQIQVTISWRALHGWHPLGVNTPTDRAARAAATRAVDPHTSIPTPAGLPVELPDGTQVGDVPVLADGQPIPISQARRLACDGQIIPAVLGGDGEILDIGRASRVVPVGLRRALNLRDGGCRFAGCDRPATWCDAHHIWFWADGGPTSIDNCVLLCAYHHTLIHKGWTIVGNPNGTLHFYRPDGTRLHLASNPRGSPSSPGSKPRMASPPPTRGP